MIRTLAMGTQLSELWLLHAGAGLTTLTPGVGLAGGAEGAAAGGLGHEAGQGVQAAPATDVRVAQAATHI